MAVRWVRCLAPFQALSAADQLVLLRAAWKDLFLLHLAQWSAPWDLAPMLAAPAARSRLPPDPLADLELNTLQVCLSFFTLVRVSAMKNKNPTIFVSGNLVQISSDIP